jgi:acylphosphatase
VVYIAFAFEKDITGSCVNGGDGVQIRVLGSSEKIAHEIKKVRKSGRFG